MEDLVYDKHQSEYLPGPHRNPRQQIQLASLEAVVSEVS